MNVIFNSRTSEIVHEPLWIAGPIEAVPELGN